MNKKNKLILIFLMIIFFISLVLKVITPKEPIVPKLQNPDLLNNIDDTQSVFSNISYSGDTALPITQLPILIEQAKTDEQKMISLITTKFGFIKDSQVKNYWQNNTEQSMTYDRFSKIYFIRISPLKITGNNLSQDQLIEIAENYINDLFQTNLSAIKQDVTYYKNAIEQPEKTSYEQADYIKIPLATNINGFPIMYRGSFDYPFFITLDMSGGVSTLSFSPSIITFKNIGEKTLINIDQAIININSGQGSIISAGVTEAATIDLKEITKGDLNKVNIEYRHDPNTGYIVPFYNFSGEVFSMDETKLIVKIITPAIKLD